MTNLKISGSASADCLVSVYSGQDLLAIKNVTAGDYNLVFPMLTSDFFTYPDGSLINSDRYIMSGTAQASILNNKLRIVTDATKSLSITSNCKFNPNFRIGTEFNILNTDMYSIGITDINLYLYVNGSNYAKLNYHLSTGSYKTVVTYTSFQNGSSSGSNYVRNSNWNPKGCLQLNSYSTAPGYTNCQGTTDYNLNGNYLLGVSSGGFNVPTPISIILQITTEATASAPLIIDFNRFLVRSDTPTRFYTLEAPTNIPEVTVLAEREDGKLLGHSKVIPSLTSESINCTISKLIYGIIEDYTQVV